MERAHPWRRRLLLAGAALAALWVLGGIIAVLLARSAGYDGLDDLEEVRDLARGNAADFVASMDDPDGDAESAAALLESAAGRFESADDRVSSAWTAPLRVLPVVGRQVRTVDALAGSASDLTAAAADAFDRMAVILDQGVTEPSGRVAAVAEAAAVLGDVDVAMEEVDLGPSEALIGPVARARDRFAEEFDEVRGQLDRMMAGVGAAEELLAGPNRYLLVTANNAEMRAGGGMFLQVGELTVEDGQVDLGELTPTADLRLPPPGVAVDPDVEARWGWLAPGREWRNTNLTPRFEESARTVAEMWEAQGGGEVDGVMVLDVVGLGYLLEVVGPITVDGEELTGEEVQEDLFLEQYAAFGGRRAEREERYDRLGRIAEATLGAFDDGDWSPEAMFRQVERAAKGRHLMMWSRHPSQQEGWEAAGVAGRVEGDSMLLAILNRGANKLDPYLRVAAEADLAEDGRVEVRVSIRNEAPSDLPAYVSGPAPGSDLAEGEYVGYVALTFPGGSKAAEVSAGPVVASGPDGPTQVLAVEVRVPRRETRELTFGFTLPDGVDEVHLEPSARAPVVNWTVGDDEYTDRRSRVLRVSR